MQGFFVGLPGFEPRQTEPKTVVLPLHNNPIRNAIFINGMQKYRYEVVEQKNFETILRKLFFPIFHKQIITSQTIF